MNTTEGREEREEGGGGPHQNTAGYLGFRLGRGRARAYIVNTEGSQTAERGASSFAHFLPISDAVERMQMTTVRPSYYIAIYLVINISFSPLSIFCMIF